MSDEQWIVVRNWRRFQMYTDRNPPWIKNLTELLHDENYLSLPGEARAILHGLWLEYASANAQLRLNTRSLSYRLRLRVTTPQLKRLEQAGFIEFMQTPRLQDVCARVRATEAEAETETKTKDQELRTYEEPSQTLESARQSIDEMLNAMLRDVE